MPHVTISEETFRRLASRASALNISVDELVRPALDRLAEAGNGAPPPEPPLPLTGDACARGVRSLEARRRAPG